MSKLKSNWKTDILRRERMLNDENFVSVYLLKQVLVYLKVMLNSYIVKRTLNY